VGREVVLGSRVGGREPAALASFTAIRRGEEVARCDECRHIVVLDRPLDVGDVPMCRACGWRCVRRGDAWCWLNPAVEDAAERLSLPLPGTLVGLLPDDLLRAFAWGTNEN
jgi:hypothetical protein